MAITEPRVERPLDNGVFGNLVGTIPRRHTVEFRPDIHGLRAVALILILLCSAGVPGPSGGYVGFDVLFVIAGFLVTGNLVSSRMGFTAFLAHRMRRLLPSALVVTLITVLGAVILLPPLLVPAVARDGLAASLNLTNIWLGLHSTGYPGAPSGSLFAHFWSISLAAQFALLWPLVLLLARSTRAAGRATMLATAAVTASSLVLFLALGPTEPGWAYLLLPTRAWEFGAGALLFLLTARPGSRAYGLVGEQGRAFLGWLGVVGLVTAVSLAGTTAAGPGALTLLPVLATLAVLHGADAPGGPVAILTLRPLQMLATISYPVYLWHWPMLVMAALLLERGLTVSEALALLVLSVLAGWATHRLVARPTRRADWLTPGTGRTVATATGALTVVVATCLVATTLPKLTTDVVVDAPTPQSVATGSAFPAVVPANITPALTAAAGDVPALYSDGCDASTAPTDAPLCRFGAVGSPRTVVLFGDSRAAQWFSPIEQWATDRGLKLVVLTDSGCPPARIAVLQQNGRPSERCAAFRETALRTIADLNPTMVVLAGLGSGYRDVWAGTRGGDSSGGDYDGAYASGLVDTIRRLPTSATTVVLGETPTWTRDPAVCLSAHPTDTAACTRPLAEVVDPASSRAQQVAVAGTAATYLDPARWLCSELCYPLAGNQLLYRDSRHLGDGAARLLEPMLAAALDRSAGEKGTRR